MTNLFRKIDVKEIEESGDKELTVIFSEEWFFQGEQLIADTGAEADVVTAGDVYYTLNVTKVKGDLLKIKWFRIKD